MGHLNDGALNVRSSCLTGYREGLSSLAMCCTRKRRQLIHIELVPDEDVKGSVVEPKPCNV
jgi:hypothetical protein